MPVVLPGDPPCAAATVAVGLASYRASFRSDLLSVAFCLCGLNRLCCNADEALHIIGATLRFKRQPLPARTPVTCVGGAGVLQLSAVAVRPAPA